MRPCRRGSASIRRDESFNFRIDPVLPLTSELYDMPLLRIMVEPSEDTGLRLRSQGMVDKATTIPRAKAGNPIGRLDEATLANVSQALAAFLAVG